MIEIKNEEGLKWAKNIVDKMNKDEMATADDDGLYEVLESAVERYNHEHHPQGEALLTRILACKDCGAPEGAMCKPECTQESYT